MLESLGPNIGWTGNFPTSYAQHLERQALTRRQLATLEAAEAAAAGPGAGTGWRKRARSAQDALEEEAERAEAREGARRGKGRRRQDQGWGSSRRGGRDLLGEGAEGTSGRAKEERQRQWDLHLSQAQTVDLEPETPWYKTMMASWQQYGCKP